MTPLEEWAREVQQKHRPHGCYDECGHEHTEEGGGVIDVEDIGLVCADGLLYTVCYACDTDDGEPREGVDEETWPCDARRGADLVLGEPRG